MPFLLVNYSCPNSFLAFRLSCFLLSFSPVTLIFRRLTSLAGPLLPCSSVSFPSPEAPPYRPPQLHTFPLSRLSRSCAGASFSELWPWKSSVGSTAPSCSFSSGLWTLKVIVVCVSSPVAAPSLWSVHCVEFSNSLITGSSVHLCLSLVLFWKYLCFSFRITLSHDEILDCGSSDSGFPFYLFCCLPFDHFAPSKYRRKPLNGLTVHC